MAASRKILAVDDDPIARKLLAHIIERSGNVPILASGAARAWGVLEDNPEIELVITDLAMPEVDGLALLKELRAHPHFTQIPVIIVSGVVKVSEIDALLRRGADRFVPKPVDALMLMNYIHDLMGSPLPDDALAKARDSKEE